MYAYSGWNASTYITGEIRNPRRNVPLSLIFGTIIVIILYVF
jgi:Amino acid permease.